MSLLQVMGDTVGKIIPHECKEDRTVEQLVEAPVQRIWKHILEEDRVAPQMQKRASNETAGGAPGAWCSFDFSVPWEISTHTESGPSLCSCGSGLFCE